jgi:hypoxanthine phosphoribosyltransferase
MASEIAASMPAASPVLLLTAGDGARRFGRELADSLTSCRLTIEADAIRQTRFRADEGSRRVRVLRHPSASIAGKHVLLVTDIVSTGVSLSYLVAWIRSRGATAVDVCTLLDRPKARLIDVPIAHSGFTAPEEWIVGYGIPFRREFGEIPHLATVILKLPS